MSKELIDEINAIVNNTEKKKMSCTTTRLIEIRIDRENSSSEKVLGEFSIVESVKYLDGSVEEKVLVKYNFINEKDFVIEKYDNKLNREVLKTVRDFVIGVALSSNGFPARFETSKAFMSPKKKIFIVRENIGNKAVRDLIDSMIFSGMAQSNVDIGPWSGQHYLESEKSIRWAILELERRVSNGEAVILTGVFDNWYELMPVVVISSMLGADISLGRSEGKKASIGNIIDLNKVFEYFISRPEVLQQFYHDPYLAIEHFKNVNNTIQSLVIFPSVFHSFLSG